MYMVALPLLLLVSSVFCTLSRLRVSFFRILHCFAESVYSAPQFLTHCANYRTLLHCDTFFLACDWLE